VFRIGHRRLAQRCTAGRPGRLMSTRSRRASASYSRAAEALDGRIRRMAHRFTATSRRSRSWWRSEGPTDSRNAWIRVVDRVSGGCAGRADRLAVESRKELVCYLADEGMSQRAIATVTGAAKTRFHRDLDEDEAGGPDGPPDRVVTGSTARPIRSRTAATRSEPRRKPITDAFWRPPTTSGSWPTACRSWPQMTDS